ncbi:MAG TPA: L,D-transpeptidase family protein [Actinomycetes bacterium]|jgi:L,D-peptidoglycan transpeptidase YkuD (ErfK/YbiS/YcfS/YnhG family)|nr:L,D-transpeptidase family protein [Actinomycetes bacterium]
MNDDENVIHVSPSGTLGWQGRRYRAALGKGGVRVDKHEGDGATPAGCFPLRRVYYRADRIARPVTGLDTVVIRPSDGWCNIPEHADYNRKVQLPHAGRGQVESLWLEEDHGRVYDIVVEIGYNDDPPIPGLGSAIFMHIAPKNFGPTEGCIGLSKDELLEVLHTASSGTLICIHPVEPFDHRRQGRA